MLAGSEQKQKPNSPDPTHLFCLSKEKRWKKQIGPKQLFLVIVCFPFKGPPLKKRNKPWISHFCGIPVEFKLRKHSTDPLDDYIPCVFLLLASSCRLCNILFSPKDVLELSTVERGLWSYYLQTSVDRKLLGEFVGVLRWLDRNFGDASAPKWPTEPHTPEKLIYRSIAMYSQYSMKSSWTESPNCKALTLQVWWLFELTRCKIVKSYAYRNWQDVVIESNWKSWLQKVCLCFSFAILLWMKLTNHRVYIVIIYNIEYIDIISPSLCLMISLL